MARLAIEASISISIVLGVILFSILGISGILSLIIIGFVATYLTVSSQRSYKTAGTAGIIFGILIFIYSLFIYPTLPVDPPSLSTSILIGLELNGIFTLILGLIVSLLICFLLGAAGGLIAQKILKEKIEKPRAHTRKSTGKVSNKPRKSLNRTYKN
jgi:hypothetical protein